MSVSFVKSILMDDWSQEQIYRMKRGGNVQQHQFFKASHRKGCASRANRALGPEGICFEQWSVADKYDSNTAVAYREQIDQRIAAPGCFSKHETASMNNPPAYLIKNKQDAPPAREMKNVIGNVEIKYSKHPRFPGDP